MTLRAIESQSLADQVFEQLIGEIMSGRSQPTSNLPSERKLVEIFKVNRHVVREALKRLEQIGLVKVSQGGGTKVVDFERTAGLDLLALMAGHAHVRADATKYWLAVHEMRAAIAADAARLCALRASLEIKRDILEIARGMSALGDGPEIFALEVRFWDRVLEGAGNVAYRLAFNTLIKAVFAPAIGAVARDWSIHEVKESGHRIPIATAIVAGDSAAAESRTRESLRVVVELLDKQVRAAESPLPPARSVSGKKPRPFVKTATKGKSRKQA